LRLTYLIMGALLLIFIGKLFVLQVLEGESYRLQADENRFSQISLPAPRGVIDSEAEIQSIYEELSQFTGVPVDQEGDRAAPCIPGRGIQQLVLEGETNSPFDTWPIACDIDETVARVLRERQIDLPGVSVSPVPIREYSTGQLTAAVIGYLGPIPEAEQVFWESLGFVAERDKVGYGGVELIFQDTLAGQNGLKLVERDVAGLELREVGAGNPAIAGNSLQLSIDTRLQAAAETALINRMDFLDRFAGEKRTSIGAVIAINPQTGEILAMVSVPTYENNRLARFIPLDYFQELAENPATPLVNHAVSLEQPPGSSFKMVTAIGALNEQVVTAERTLFDGGLITIQNTYFPNDPGKAKDFVCWKEDGHGDIDFVHGIAQSCNVYFYKIGGGFEDEVAEPGLGVTNVGNYARALGYGGLLGIDLPGEELGLIPDREWKRINLGESWSTGDTYNTVVGQGFVNATPLQVLTSVTTLANGGRVMWPHVVKEVLDGEGNVVHQYEPCVLWDIADGILTPVSEIGSRCDSMDPSVLSAIRSSRLTSPDVLVDQYVIQMAQEGMGLVVTEGTAAEHAQLDAISSGGKTGTGEFCDEKAFREGQCIPGEWPTHSWYTAFAPFENPEIAVVAFVYNGGEGAVTAGPIVKQVMDAYFELKAIDASR
jgi:penicillin-binding protein 2